jgi:hypothetical protein
MRAAAATAEAGRMDTVRSTDQTSIAYWTSGDGPPPVLVHGGTAEAAEVRVEVMPGQQHVAIDTAPELFARLVVAFLTGDGTAR